MPVTGGGEEQFPQTISGILPDLHDPFLTRDEMPHRATIKTEIPNNSPATIPDFDLLSPEEQERIALQYRYMGIRLRTDMEKFATVPLRKETMELP